MFFCTLKLQKEKKSFQQQVVLGLEPISVRMRFMGWGGGGFQHLFRCHVSKGAFVVSQIMIRSIFLFLDRTYVLQNSMLPSIW